MSANGDSGGGFQHEALFYADDEELLAGTIPFLRAGIEAEEAILVAMPPSNLELLKGALNGEAEQVQFINMQELGRNPARIISAWQDFLAARLTEERRIRGIGEPIWAGRTSAELEECARHEALLNLAFADSPAWALLCPYNTTELDEHVLASAEHNHPVLCDASTRRTSDGYADPRLNGGPFQGELEPPAAVLAEMTFRAGQLAEVRRAVGEHARLAGLDSQRVADLVLAVSEAATNSLQHGGGSGTLSVWCHGERIGCDIRDDGRIDEPLVGRKRPAASQLGGHGLWLANQLCDLVQIRSGRHGSLVRLQMTRP